MSHRGAYAFRCSISPLALLLHPRQRLLQVLPRLPRIAHDDDGLPVSFLLMGLLVLPSQSRAGDVVEDEQCGRQMYSCRRRRNALVILLQTCDAVAPSQDLRQLAAKLAGEPRPPVVSPAANREPPKRTRQFNVADLID